MALPSVAALGGGGSIFLPFFTVPTHKITKSRQEASFLVAELIEGEKAQIGKQGSAHERWPRAPPSPRHCSPCATLAGPAGSACAGWSCSSYMQFCMTAYFLR